jgi:hypothetical protein
MENWAVVCCVPLTSHCPCLNLQSLTIKWNRNPILLRLCVDQHEGCATWGLIQQLLISPPFVLTMGHFGVCLIPTSLHHCIVTVAPAGLAGGVEGGH